MNKRTWKTVLLAVSAAFAGSGVKAQQGFTVQAEIKGWSAPYAYLIYKDEGVLYKDTAKVAGGKFSFQGKVVQPALANIVGKTSGGVTGFAVYIENSNINVNGVFDSLQNVTVTGSQTHDDYKMISSAHNDIQRQERALYKDYNDAKASGDEGRIKTDEDKLSSFDMLNTQVSVKFAQSHPKSYLSLGEISSLLYTGNYNGLISLYTGLDTSLQNSVYGKQIGSVLQNMEKAQTGKTAPVFEQNDTAGKTVSLSDFKGKYVLVDFWASWCAPCRAQNPGMVKVYDEYKDKNFAVLGVSLDQDKGFWTEAIRKDGLPWTQVSDLQGNKNAAAVEYGVAAIPQNFLIDPSGKIIAHNLQGEELEAKLKSVLM